MSPIEPGEREDSSSEAEDWDEHQLRSGRHGSSRPPQLIGSTDAESTVLPSPERRLKVLRGAQANRESCRQPGGS